MLLSFAIAVVTTYRWMSEVGLKIFIGKRVICVPASELGWEEVRKVKVWFPTPHMTAYSVASSGVLTKRPTGRERMGLPLK